MEIVSKISKKQIMQLKHSSAKNTRYMGLMPQKNTQFTVIILRKLLKIVKYQLL